MTSSSHLTYIRIMMLEIRDRINVPVEINDSTVKSLYLNLVTGNYSTIMMYHGEEFTTEMMEMYSNCELYEVCADVRDAISDVNALIQSLDAESPT